uniref:Uncharacterized protein n=1 Tax=Magallana gigas TaxID=29159 RepID=K1R950_MAGGI
MVKGLGQCVCYNADFLCVGVCKQSSCELVIEHPTQAAVRKKQTVCLCNKCRDREGRVPFFKDREGEGKKGRKKNSKEVTHATEHAEASDPDSDQTLQFDCY